MTWTKLSDDFGDQCADLSDAAFRTHVEGLLWTMRRETDGAISKRDISRFAESALPDDAVVELVARGFWTECDNGYLIEHHIEHQPDSETLTARRNADALRQSRKRRKAAGLDVSDHESRRDTPRDSERDSCSDTPSDDTRDPGRVGTERDGTGLEGKQEGFAVEVTANVSTVEPVSKPVLPTDKPTCSEPGCEIDGSVFSLVNGKCRRHSWLKAV